MFQRASRVARSIAFLPLLLVSACGGSEPDASNRALAGAAGSQGAGGGLDGSGGDGAGTAMVAGAGGDTATSSAGGARSTGGAGVGGGSGTGGGVASSGIIGAALGEGVTPKPATTTMTTPTMSWDAGKVLVLAVARAVGGQTNIAVTVPTVSGAGLVWTHLTEACMDGCIDASKRIDAFVLSTTAAGSAEITITSPIPATFFWSLVAYSGVDTSDPIVRSVAQWPPGWWPNSRVDFSPPIAAGNVGVGAFMLGGLCTLDAPAVTVASVESTAYAHRQGYVAGGATGIQCTYPVAETYHSSGIGIELRAQ